MSERPAFNRHRDPGILLSRNAQLEERRAAYQKYDNEKRQLIFADLLHHDLLLHPSVPA
jgi:hypothetical protein